MKFDLESLKLRFPDLEISDEYKTILRKVEEGDNIFITGGGGVGKSTLIKILKYLLKEDYLVITPTGVSACRINAVTIHSLFQFPPKLLDYDSIYQVINNYSQDKKEVLKMVKYLIVDEISMVRSDLFTSMSEVLKVIRDDPRPFGGVQIMLFGDIFQLPPVVQKKDEAIYLKEIYNGIYFFECNDYIKGNFKFYELSKIYRQTDIKLIEALNRVRLGLATNDDIKFFNERVISETIFESKFPEYIYLCTINSLREKMNSFFLDKIDSKLYNLKAYTEGNYNFKSSMLDENLKLKVGAQVMHLVNDNGLVNGSIGTVEKISDNLEEVYIKVNNNVYCIKKYKHENIDFSYKNKKVEEILKGRCYQFPLTLAWAITVHKAQSATFEKLYIDLGNYKYGVFAEGQLYTALSRCTNIEQVGLKRPIVSSDIINNKTIIDFYLSNKGEY